MRVGKLNSEDGKLNDERISFRGWTNARKVPILQTGVVKLKQVNSKASDDWNIKFVSSSM